MVILSILVMFTGVLLYLWPKGPQSGRIEILGFRKDDWRDIHMNLSIILTVVLIIHILENRKCVAYYVKTTIGGTSK
ncbi:MAG: DUF4405 domain-containing protein [Nitrososphaerota archaeon]